MLYDFLLVSLKNSDGDRIKSELERNKLYRVQMVDRAEDALEKIKESRIHCVVFNLESFTKDKISFATHLRSLGFNFPIMFFASYVQKEALEELQKIKKTILIEKPFESKDAWGIADKIVQGRAVPQRFHRRFYTNQKALIQIPVSGDSFLGQIFNLSKGGAYVEIKDGSFSAGDILRLTVPLDKVAKSYTLDAEVMWYSNKGFWQGQPAIGVRFIKSEDIYRNLLDKL